MNIFQEVKQALSILRYLKRVKTAKGGRRGRVINIVLCTMQIISPLFAEVVLIMAVATNPRL